MAGAMKNVEGELADRNLLALVEPAVGPEIAHAGHAEALAAGDHVLEQIFVGDMRPLDFHTQRVAQLGGAAELRDALGVKIEGPHIADKYLLENVVSSGERFGMTDMRKFWPERWSEVGEKLSSAELRFIS